MIDWEAIACCCGYVVEEIPKDLVEIFEHLDEKIKDANGLRFVSREEFGIKSTQTIGLVVLLWEMGILKLENLEKLDSND